MAALDGILVMDLTHVVAGPLCTMLLGDMGANVIKVERPGRGDHIRGWPPSWNGTACAFLALNRNKRSITLDLKNPAGRDVAKKLAEKADVVVESLRPGSLRKIGLGYDDIKERNPRVVYCSPSAGTKTSQVQECDLIGVLYRDGVKGKPPKAPQCAAYVDFVTQSKSTAFLVRSGSRVLPFRSWTGLHDVPHSPHSLPAAMDPPGLAAQGLRDLGLRRSTSGRPHRGRRSDRARDVAYTGDRRRTPRRRVARDS